MKINVAAIKGMRGASVSFDFTVAPEGLRVDGGDFSFASPVRICGTAADDGQGIIIEGILQATLQEKCARCLEPFLLTLQEDFFEKFVEWKPQKDMHEAEDSSLSHYQGDVISIAELVRELIMLALPMRPICSEDCRGLCSKCGKNLNKSVCNCSLEVIDIRLAGLKQLFEKE